MLLLTKQVFRLPLITITLHVLFALKVKITLFGCGTEMNSAAIQSFWNQYPISWLSTEVEHHFATIHEKPYGKITARSGVTT
jgi:hypothetical protein